MDYLLDGEISERQSEGRDSRKFQQDFMVLYDLVLSINHKNVFCS